MSNYRKLGRKLFVCFILLFSFFNVAYAADIDVSGAAMESAAKNLRATLETVESNPDSGGWGLVISSSVDLATAAVQKLAKGGIVSGANAAISKQTITNMLTERLAKINMKEVGKGLVKDLVIDIISDTIGAASGSNAARGASWYVMKQGLAIADAAGVGKNALTFQIAFAYEQAQLLGAVIQKDVAEYNQARNDIDAAAVAEIRGQLSDFYALDGNNQTLLRTYYQSTDKATRDQALDELKKNATSRLSFYLSEKDSLLDVLSADRAKIATEILAKFNAGIEGDLLRSKFDFVTRLNSGTLDASANPELLKNYFLTKNERDQFAMLQTNQTANAGKLIVENKKLDAKNAEIDDQEYAIQQKKKELTELEFKLSNTNEYLDESSSSSSTKIDINKFDMLVKAKKLVEKYASVSWDKWDAEDQVKLKIIARNLGITFGQSPSMTSQALYLRTQLTNGNFAFLRDTYAVTIDTSTATTRVYNSDYKELKSGIEGLMTEIKTLNHDLNLDQMEKENLQLSVNNLDDINSKNKVSVALQSNAARHESWWSGAYTKNTFGESDLGDPIIYGYGDSEARTRGNKPDNGVNLDLMGFDSNGDVVLKSMTLHNSESEYLGNYNYVGWGTWSDPNAAEPVYTSHWVVVDHVDSNQKPKQGSASYAGELRGILYGIGQANTVHNADGDISLTANFGQNTINGNMTVRNADTHVPFASASFNTSMQSSSDGDGLEFHGQLTGAGISNSAQSHSQIRGNFGGDQAAEVGGMWAITKGTGANGDGRAIGVFRAKKQ